MNLVERRWTQSIPFDLILSFAAGLIYTALMLGLHTLDSANISWIGPDATNYYVAWQMLRQDPHLHWPLSFTTHLGYPFGESTAVLDINPLLALLLLPLSPWLPGIFQYFGLAAVIGSSLQFFFAIRIFRFLVGPRFLPPVLCAVFLLLSPPLAYRMSEHFALANQWLILAGLLIFVRAVSRRQIPATRRIGFSSLVLTACAFAVNPYLAVMVIGILVSTLASLLWLRRISMRGAAAFLAGLILVSAMSAWAIGFIDPAAAGYTSGFGKFSTNLLSPIDPNVFGAYFWRALPSMTEQYEGYAYLGAGFLALALAACIPAIHRIRIDSILVRQVTPLLLCCAAFSILAISSKAALGAHVIWDVSTGFDLRFPHFPFRASGRFIWVAYYSVMIAVLAAAFRLWSLRTATLIVGIALALQVVDTGPVRQWVHRSVSYSHPSPLISAEWSKLGQKYRHLVVLPAWQCGLETPGGKDGYRYFGLLAAEQRMTINSYSSGRYSDVSLDFHCDTNVLDTVNGPLDGKSFYVVTEAIAKQIEKGPSGPSNCRSLDSFHVCAASR